MSLHPLTRHYSVLRSLPGVQDVEQIKQVSGEAIQIHTADAFQAAFLDDILADNIGGSPVRFVHDGPEIGIAQKEYYPAEAIIEDYGKLLRGIPGVCHLDTVRIEAGEWLPAFETGVKVVACSKADRQFLSEMLEPEMAGTKIVVANN